MKTQRKIFSHDPIPDMSFSCVFSFLSAGSKQWPVSGLLFFGFFVFFFTPQVRTVNKLVSGRSDYVHYGQTLISVGGSESGAAYRVMTHKLGESRLAVQRRHKSAHSANCSKLCVALGVCESSFDRLSLEMQPSLSFHARKQPHAHTGWKASPWLRQPNDNIVSSIKRSR